MPFHWPLSALTCLIRKTLNITHARGAWWVSRMTSLFCKINAAICLKFTAGHMDDPGNYLKNAPLIKINEGEDPYPNPIKHDGEWKIKNIWLKSNIWFENQFSNRCRQQTICILSPTFTFGGENYFIQSGILEIYNFHKLCNRFGEKSIHSKRMKRKKYILSQGLLPYLVYQ